MSSRLPAVIFFLLTIMSPLKVKGQKMVFIPTEWDTRNIPYSMDRSYQSDNFVIFWGEKAGADPLIAPEDIRFDPAITASFLEDIFSFYLEEVHMIPPDHGNFALYKFIIVINETWNPLDDGSNIFTGWAFGGAYESTIGAMWVHPKALNKFTLAHEFTHSMQNMIWIDYPGHGFINNDYVGSFWETHANFMALQANPSELESTDPARFLNTQNFYWSSARHHYTNWMFLQYLLDTEGMEFINSLWRESNIGEHPLETLKRLKGFSQDELNDLFIRYAMRNVAFDYSNGDEIRYSLANEIDNRYIGRRFTIPDVVSASTHRYKVPFHLAPQDYGYNIVRLFPNDGNAESIDITFRIHQNFIAGGGGSRTGFVFMKDDGTLRYGKVFTDDFNTELNPEPDENIIYMVVLGAPSRHHNYAWEPGFPKIYRFPWEFRIEGAVPDGYQANFNSNYIKSGGHAHPNGGGYVASTAVVSLSAYVASDAVVADFAVVEGNARIEGKAVVRETAYIKDNALISGFALIGGNAKVSNNSIISEFARVNNGAVLRDDSEVRGSGMVFNSTLSGSAIVKDNAFIWGANLSGDIVVGGDGEHFGSCSSGKYLQIFNLGGRGCDGLVIHLLNEDINPSYTMFTDQEMGVTSVNKLADNYKPYVIQHNTGSDDVTLQSINNMLQIKSISVVDITGRIIVHSRYSKPVSNVNLTIPGEGIFIMTIRTGNGNYYEKFAR